MRLTYDPVHKSKAMHCNKLANGEISSDPSKLSNNCKIKECVFTRLVAGVEMTLDATS